MSKDLSKFPCMCYVMRNTHKNNCTVTYGRVTIVMHAFNGSVQFGCHHQHTVTLNLSFYNTYIKIFIMTLTACTFCININLHIGSTVHFREETCAPF